MNRNATASLIQDWYVINDDRWANLLETSHVKKAEPRDIVSLPAAA